MSPKNNEEKEESCFIISKFSRLIKESYRAPEKSLEVKYSKNVSRRILVGLHAAMLVGLPVFVLISVFQNTRSNSFSDFPLQVNGTCQDREKQEAFPFFFFSL
jgi:hypothetical protein